MFAVMKTGGKQYRVAPGDVLRVERLSAEAGERIQFNDVLMVGGDTVTLGTPTVAGAAVQADVIDQIRGEKVVHFVKRRRKHSSKRTKGHRQHLTLLRVTDILSSGADASGVKAAVGTGSVSMPEATPAAAAPQESAPAKPATTLETAVQAAKPAPKVKPDAAVTEGERPANLLDAPRDGAADDLKKLSGVGPKLESVLNQNGVYHFDQIAGWGDDEVAYMDDKLSFKGRIARDNWIDQAATFAAEKE